MRTDIEFKAEGVTLRGWLYEPPAVQEKTPLVIATHGFSAVKEMSLDKLGEHLSSAGFSVLIYDHRNLGASDGSPRGEIDPLAQVRDYRHAISYAETLPNIDPDRIGIWGTSYSGSHVFVVAAVDKRVKAVVSQVPMLSAYATLQRLQPGMEYPDFIKQLEEDRRNIYSGKAPAVIPITSNDPSIPHAFPGIRTWEYFETYKDCAPNWDNKVTLRSMDLLLEYDCTPFIHRISPIPLLMVVAERDLTTPTDLALAAYEDALEPKKLVILPGDHYDSYLKHFEIGANAARDWFLEHL